LEAGGRFKAPKLTALKHIGPLQITVKAIGLVSNSHDLGVNIDPGGLMLSASKSELEYLAGDAVEFTVTYYGAALPAGTQVTPLFEPGELGGLSAAYILQANGKFTVPNLTALSHAGPLAIKVQAVGLESSEAFFDVIINPGGLGLSANVTELEYLSQTVVTLTVTYMGYPLDTGTLVETVFDADDFNNLAGSYQTSGAGQFTANQMAAQKPQGPLSLKVRAWGLESNSVLFNVRFDSQKLGLSASPDVFELFRPDNAAFTFTYNAIPLPAGVPVTLSASSGLLENLPASGQTTGQGRLSAPNLTAIKASGPIEVSGTAWGFSAGTVELAVFVQAQYFSSSLDISPKITGPGGSTEPYVSSCVNFTVTLALTYRGRNLSNHPAEIYGFKLSSSGSVTTDGLGRVTGLMTYSEADVSPGQTGMEIYRVIVGGTEFTVPGPQLLDFLNCG
jgi:hypothetical protein